MAKNGNKHGGRKTRIKDWENSKHRRQSLEAKKANHSPRKEKKDARIGRTK